MFFDLKVLTEDTFVVRVSWLSDLPSKLMILVGLSRPMNYYPCFRQFNRDKGWANSFLFYFDMFYTVNKSLLVMIFTLVIEFCNLVGHSFDIINVFFKAGLKVEWFNGL